MSRIRIYRGIILFIGTAIGGCCYPGSPYCQNSYPNKMGYTYPNWMERQTLVTPPNPPQDGLQYGYGQQLPPGAQYFDNGGVSTGTTPAPSFGPQGSGTRVPTGVAPGSTKTGDNWTPRADASVP